MNARSAIAAVLAAIVTGCSGSGSDGSNGEPHPIVTSRSRALMVAFHPSSGSSQTSGSSGSSQTDASSGSSQTSGSSGNSQTDNTQPIPRGLINAELVVTRIEGGASVDGLKISIQPWMPSMNHGAIQPMVTPLGGGKYSMQLDLYMAGFWELKTTFSGPIDDYAEPTFEVQ